MMTETPRGLATLALLKTRFDEGRDHLELFEPFVADAAFHSSEDWFLPRDIVSLVQARSGLTLPSDVVKTVLHRLARRRDLSQEGGRFLLSELTDPSLAKARAMQESKQTTLAEALLTTQASGMSLRGWELLENGELIQRARRGRVRGHRDDGPGHAVPAGSGWQEVAIVVLMATAWPRVQHRTAEIRAAVEEVRPGELREVPIPCPG